MTVGFGAVTVPVVLNFGGIRFREKFRSGFDRLFGLKEDGDVLIKVNQIGQFKVAQLHSPDVAGLHAFFGS